MEIFKNLFLGCCYSDNRMDNKSDMITAPVGNYENGRTKQNNQQHKVIEADELANNADIPIGGTFVPVEEIKKAQLLKIEVIEGLSLKKGTTLIINA